MRYKILQVVQQCKSHHQKLASVASSSTGAQLPSQSHSAVDEVLRRVLEVMNSNDPLARALTLRSVLLLAQLCTFTHRPCRAASAPPSPSTG